MNVLHSSTCVAATGLALMSAALEAGEFVFNTETLIADGEWNNPSSVAIDDAGAIHVAYMTQHHTDSATKEIWYASKPAGGASWSFLQITDNTVREEFPHLVLDE